MNENEILSSISSLRQQSRISLFLVVLGASFLAFSVYYSASRLTPLENEISAKRAAIEELKSKEAFLKSSIGKLQASYDKLRSNTESLYSVKVTPTQQVYEVKATARATGMRYSNGLPEYTFSLFINSSPATLADIKSVTYRMDHPTFKQKDYVSTDENSQFSASYKGWGCLTSVEVTVLLKSGASQKLNFNMCRSLGPQWQ